MHEDAVGHDFTPEKRWLRSMAATVADCHLYDGGHIYPSAIGVWIGNSGENRIQHNEIHHFPYVGISFGWTWFWNSTRTWDNRIEHNHIHHINHEQVLSDNGGIYSLGVQPGSRVVGNHLHDIACYHYGGWGIYPDQGSSNILFENNLVHRTEYGAFAVNSARFLRVQNNIFAAMKYQVLTPGRTDLGRGQTFERNLVWFDRDNLKADVDWDPLLTATKKNLVWNAGAGGVRWHKGSLAKENAVGRWLESVEVDPLFRDPRGGDFTLREDSPAFALGFKPFDWRRAGVRPATERKSSWSDYRRPAAASKALAVAHIKAGEFRTAGDFREGNFEVTLWNPSGGKVRGRWEVLLDDGTPIKVTPGRKLLVDLAPGESIVRKLNVRVPTSAKRPWLLVKGDERTSFSAAIQLISDVEVTAPRLPAGTGFPLKEGLDLLLDSTGTPIMTGRLAVVGEALALDLTVRDATLRVNHTNPWFGASVEIFAGAESKREANRVHPPKQFIIIPPCESGPAEVRSFTGVDLPRQEWDIVPVPGGWRTRVSLPLSAFGVDPKAEHFRLDFMFNINSPVPGQNFIRLPLFGPGHNASDVSDLAKVLIKK